MRYAISFLLVLLIGFLAYMLFANIKEPITFHAEKTAREEVVFNKLDQIRESQTIFKDITGKFAHDFDTLISVLKTDSIEFVKVIGDPDSEDEFITTYTYSPAIDSIRAMGINLDSLRYVPFSSTGKHFDIKADTITYQQTLVHVCEVGTRYKEFMGKYASEKFARYDNLYKPSGQVKFGNMEKPTLNGNW